MNRTETGTPIRSANRKLGSPLAELLDQIAREVVRRLKKKATANDSSTTQQPISGAAGRDSDDCPQ